MSKIGLIIEREYLTRVKNKTFIISTFMLPLVMILFIVGSAFFAVRSREKQRVAVVNDPGFYDSTLFKGHTMTYYGRWTYKYEEAARQGAKACLIIHNTAAASYPFSVVQSSNGGVKLHLDTRSNPSYQLTVQGWITEATGKKLRAHFRASS